MLFAYYLAQNEVTVVVDDDDDVLAGKGKRKKERACVRVHTI
jgi:hypothetical protein